MVILSSCWRIYDARAAGTRPVTWRCVPAGQVFSSVCFMNLRLDKVTYRCLSPVTERYDLIKRNLVRAVVLHYIKRDDVNLTRERSSFFVSPSKSTRILIASPA